MQKIFKYDHEKLGLVRSQYEFKPPKYGKSNTDQSYYEPVGSLIANAFRSGGAGSPSPDDYDFKASDFYSDEEMSKRGVYSDPMKKSGRDKMPDAKRVAILTKKGRTREENSQLVNEIVDNENYKGDIATSQKEAEENQLKFVDTVKERIENPTQNNSSQE